MCAGSVAGEGMEIGRYANLVAVGATRRMLASPITPAFPCACNRSYTLQSNKADTSHSSRTCYNEFSLETSVQHHFELDQS